MPTNIFGYDINKRPKPIFTDPEGLLISKPYLMEIAEGGVSNHAPFSKLGYTPSIGTTTAYTDIWSYAGTQPTYLFPTAAMGMEVLSSDNTVDIGTTIKSGTSTGGTTTTLIDTGVDFTASTAVAVGDIVILDKSGTSPEFGYVTAIATNQLTCSGGFSRGGSGSGRVYAVLDKSAKAGAQAVEINYLDGSYAEKREIIILNGTTVVPTVNLDIFRINSFRVVVTGTNAAPTGNLTIRHLSDTPVYSYISAGFNRARNAMFTVPAGKNVYITHWVGGYATTGNANKEYARITPRANIDPTTGFQVDGLFYPSMDILAQNTSVETPLIIPFKLPAKTDVKMSAIASATGVISTMMIGWMETA